jgi:predicted KAP-like P-loop ATPase
VLIRLRDRGTLIIRGLLRRDQRISPESGIVEPSGGLSVYETNQATLTVRSDNPIRHSADDALGRAAAAQSFAHQILRLDASEGVVVGVLGPWGSGKTSFVNIARPEFERNSVQILEFNPWMFSGAEQLVESFFIELAAQLRIRPGLADLGQDLADYGESFSGMGWLPFVGSWIERGRGAIKILAKLLERRKQGVASSRAKLEKALSKLDKPILVFIDDIDRLSTSEIRHVFKLVRLTASFPNMIYLVAFDRQRVEDALAEVGVPGRTYLEKILQIALDLPAIPIQVLSRQITSAVDAALAGIEKPGPFHDQVWPDVFAEVVRPLIRNMRDVRRYAAAVRGTVAALDGQIALEDVLALEAVRVFLPDVFARFHDSVEGLTKTSGFPSGDRGDPQGLKAQIDGLIAASPTHSAIVSTLISRLFPAGRRHMGGSQFTSDWKGEWLRERRVAHEDILRLYLERIVGEGLKAFIDAEQAWARFTDRNALDDYLRSLDRERLQDIIASLETYEGQFGPEHVLPGTIVLLNLQPDLPKRDRGMLELDSRFTVLRVTYRLLRSLREPNEVEAAIRKILPELTTLSSKLELITQVGHRDGAGHKLVSESAAKEFYRSWRDEVRGSPAKRLVEEWDLARVLYLTKHEADSSEGPLNIDSSPELTLALLRASRSEVTSQSLGSRAVRRSPQLAWDVLTELYGDEATLRERIENLKATNPKAADDILALADKYLGGWRPNKFGEE